MSEELKRDNLVAGDFPVITDSVSIAAGQNLARGTVLGRITKGTASVAAAGAGSEGANTGNGTLTMDATTPLLANSKPGVYIVRMTAATAADVYDPEGDIIGKVATGATFSKEIKFALAAGATPFVAGDGFAVTVAAGNSTYKIVNSANVDGSEKPEAVLLEAVDASLAAKNGTIGLTGEYNVNSLVFGGSDTAATHKDALRAKSIFIKSALGA